MSLLHSAGDLIERKYAPDGPEAVRTYQGLRFDKHLRLLQMYMRLGPGMRVLDVGCGTGALLAELARAGMRAVGIDTFEEADGIDLEIARARLRDHQVDAPVLRATAAGLPFADGVFDVAVNIGMLEHLPPDIRPAILREMFRVVAPGGHLFLIAGPTNCTPIDQHIPGHPFANWLSRERKMEISRRAGRRQFLAVPWGISRSELHNALPDGEFISLYSAFFRLDGGQPLGRFRPTPLWFLAWAKRTMRLHRVIAGAAQVLYWLHQEHCHILLIRKRVSTLHDKAA
jgi:SAM-dependent methyltransferase